MSFRHAKCVFDVALPCLWVEPNLAPSAPMAKERSRSNDLSGSDCQDFRKKRSLIIAAAPQPPSIERDGHHEVASLEHFLCCPVHQPAHQCRALQPVLIFE